MRGLQRVSQRSRSQSLRPSPSRRDDRLRQSPRGTGNRIRQTVNRGVAFDAGRQHLTLRAGKASIEEGHLILRDPGNENFDPWKFSRGLHRVALGVLARGSGPDQALSERFDGLRRYIREPKGRSDFWGGPISSDRRTRFSETVRFQSPWPLRGFGSVLPSQTPRPTST